MPKKNESETIAQQRKARQEFLNLKKMQNGEMEAPPKPSEVAVKPQTAMEKWQNIWFHDKWLIIILALIIASIAFLTVQCATKTKYDATVVVFTYTLTGDKNCEAMAEYIKPYAKDINGDGEVNISVVNCSFNNADGNSEYSYAARTRAQTMLAGEASALLFITDSESYEHLSGISEGGPLFEGEPIVFKDDFYEKCDVDELFDMPENLQISCRRIEGTSIESDKNIEAYYDLAQDVLNGLKEEYSK